MGIIFLVRHGQAVDTAYGHDADSTGLGGLTALGREQAGAAGVALVRRAKSIEVAVTGTLGRQQETADLALSAANDSSSVVRDARWNEYDFESVVGERAVTESGPGLQRTVDESLVEWISGRVPVGPHAETYLEYAARCKAALDDLARRVASSETAVVFSSSGTITNVIAQLWGVDPAGWVTMSRTMVNGSISKLIVGQRGVSVVSINEHAHLEVPSQLMTFR